MEPRLRVESLIICYADDFFFNVFELEQDVRRFQEVLPKRKYFRIFVNSKWHFGGNQQLLRLDQ